MQSCVNCLEEYKLIFSFPKGDNVSFLLKPLKVDSDLDDSRRKLYIVKDGDIVLYIGETSTSIKTRFQRSFVSYRYYMKNNIARGGYKGYKWIEYYSKKTELPLSVFVVTFNEKYDNDRDFVEAVEGELVFLVRCNSGKWPNFQNEIHFRNNDEARSIAEKIFEWLVGKSE